MTTVTDGVANDTFKAEIVPNSSGSTWYLSLMQIVAIALLLLAILIGYGRWSTGSFDLVWTWLSGNQLLFTPTNIELGEVPANAVIDQQIQVRNVSTIPLTILGAQASCRCLGLDNFPIKVAAGEQQILKIRIASGPRPGRLSHSIKFFFDGDMCSSVIVSVTGTIP